MGNVDANKLIYQIFIIMLGIFIREKRCIRLQKNIIIWQFKREKINLWIRSYPYFIQFLN
jgi:hypothetical protein